MHADQAIFTSLERRGRAGYHLVSRSPGIQDAEARALERWCPSHAGLISDDENPVSVNFFRLDGGRFVVARTCHGRPEFSGRGGRQVYTRALVLDLDVLRRSGFRPLLIYRDAFALGHLHYRAEPPPSLPGVELSSYAEASRRPDGSSWGRDMGMPGLNAIVAQLNAGQPVVASFAGDRVAFVESILGQVEPEALPGLSFATSLRPSNVRPFLLHVVPPGAD